MRPCHGCDAGSIPAIRSIKIFNMPKASKAKAKKKKLQKNSSLTSTNNSSKSQEKLSLKSQSTQATKNKQNTVDKSKDTFDSKNRKSKDSLKPSKSKQPAEKNKITGGSKNSSDKNNSKKNPEATNRNILKFSRQKTEVIISVVTGLLVLCLTYTISFVFIPHINNQTTDTKKIAEQENNLKEEQERLKLLELEDQKFAGDFDKYDATLKTNFGNISIDLKYSAAPSTVESFIRLADRDYYDGTKIHRIVEQDNFRVIQGGDPNSKNEDPSDDGRGGQSAFGVNLEDELWKVEPEFNQNTPPNLESTESPDIISNNPEFSDPSLYGSIDKKRGTVDYRKGLIIMAKGQGPNTAGSQFFITLDSTTLPAQYTIFGKIKPESLAILDKISSEVDPVARNQGMSGSQENPPQQEPQIVPDGVPSQEIVIEDVELTKS